VEGMRRVLKAFVETRRRKKLKREPARPRRRDLFRRDGTGDRNQTLKHELEPSERQEGSGRRRVGTTDHPGTP
jgi:hypothetical protein